MAADEIPSPENLQAQLREIEDWLVHHVHEDHAHLAPDLAAVFRQAADDAAARLRRLLFTH